MIIPLKICDGKPFGVMFFLVLAATRYFSVAPDTGSCGVDPIGLYVKSTALIAGVTSGYQQGCSQLSDFRSKKCIFGIAEQGG
jgi:hypothetical protein